MGTSYQAIFWWTINPSLKEIFGNQKNYLRWVAIQEDNIWRNWLISMGWRG